MTTPQNNIRLRPSTQEFLDSQRYESGALYYNSNKNTLTLMDGVTKGGYELLRADLANIAGGSGGSGAIDFGNRTIVADAFQGDGSLLTNLPIPVDLATQTYVNTLVSNTVKSGTVGQVAFYDTTTSIDAIGAGVVWDSVNSKLIVEDLEVTGSLLASITLTSLGFPAGVVVNEFSIDGTLAGDSDQAVPTEKAVKTYIDTAVSGIDTSASGVVNVGTLGRLAFYATSENKVSQTEADLVYDPALNILTATNITVTADFVTDDITATTGEITTFNSTTGNITTVNATTVDISGDLRTASIINTGTGVPRWTSGSDFVIDAAGDVDVVGSKIRNLATPLISTDAANKAYVDGAAAAFSGGTVTGVTNFTNTTEATDVNSGAVTIDGGLGVNGAGWFGGLIYSGGSPVLTSSSGGFNGGVIGAPLFINNATVSTGPTSGALRVLGGVGIQGQLYSDPDIFANGIRFGRGADAQAGSNTNVIAGGGAGNDAPLAVNATGASNVAVGYNTLSAITTSSFMTAVGRGAMGQSVAGEHSVAVGYLAMNSSGSSINSVAVGSSALITGTGDNQVAIGASALRLSTGTSNIAIGYLAGFNLATGNNNVLIGGNDGVSIDGLSNRILLSDGAGNIRASWDDNGKLTSIGAVSITNNTDSLSTTEGALTVSGGVGIGAKVNIGGTLNVIDATDATSTSAGSIVTLGGIAAAKAIHAAFFYGDGSNITNVIANSFGGGTVSGATNFTNNTASTGTTTGAVRVTGGLGVQGRVSAANFNGVVVPGAAVAPGANAFVRTDGNGYAYVNYIHSNTNVETITAPGNFIVTNGGTDQNFFRKTSAASVKTALFAARNQQAGSQTTTLLTATGSLGGIEMFATDSVTAAAFIGFHRPNRYGSYFGLDTDNQFAVGGWSAGAALANMKVGSFGVGTAASGTAGEIRATNNVTAFFSSDIKFKENVREIPNALEKVVAIGGKLFSWTDAYLKDHGGEDDYFLRKEDFGVIAQDVEKVFPQAVHKRVDGSLAVDYEKLSALAFAAIVELTKRVEQLEKDR
jgi:hypothetical protein